MKSCKENNFIMIINNHIDFELEEKQMQYGLAFVRMCYIKNRKTNEQAPCTVNFKSKGNFLNYFSTSTWLSWLELD